MKIKLIGEPKIIMENQNSVHNYFAWPSVTRLQNGKIAAVASGYRLEHICPFGKAVITYSEDEGETYTRPAPVIDTYLDDRDAGICTFGESGVILTSFNNSVEQQRIWNNSSWMLRKEKEREYRTAYLNMVPQEGQKKFLGSTFCISHDCGVTFGEIHKCPVTSPHGPCVLKDGTILWVGSEFNHDSQINCEINQIQAYKINLDGTSEKVGEIENCVFEGESVASCEPHAIQLNDGTIICHIRVQKYGEGQDVFTVYQSESKNGGKNWTKPHKLLDRLGGSPAHLLQLSNGTVVSVYGYRKEPDGRIKAMISKDNCKTWKTDFEIYNNGNITADIGYPATVELKDGSLLTVFYAHSCHGAPAVIMQQKWKIEE